MNNPTPNVSHIKKIPLQVKNAIAIHPQFSSCDIYVLQADMEAKGTIFSPEAITKALGSIVGIPIVGEHHERLDDFGDHGGKWKDLDYIPTTKPYGFVPESVEVEWVTTQKNEQFLVLRGCILWTGRYPESLAVIEEGKGQSMEVVIQKGRYDTVADHYIVDEFYFSALCILGDHIRPAFRGASIYHADTFNEDFHELQSVWKGSDMTMSMEPKEKEPIEVPPIQVPPIEEPIVEPIEETPMEEPIVEPIEEPKEEPIQVQPQVFSEGTQEEPIQEAPIEEAPIEEEPQAFSEEPIQVEPIQVPQTEEPMNYSSLVERLSQEITELQGENAYLREIIAELRTFKESVLAKEHEAQAKALFVRMGLEESDLEGINIQNMSLEVIEEKAYALLGKKFVAKKEEGTQPVRFSLQPPTTDPNDSYGGIFSKYKK